jgi:hypothetical protein
MTEALVEWLVKAPRIRLFMANLARRAHGFGILVTLQAPTHQLKEHAHESIRRGQCVSVARSRPDRFRHPFRRNPTTGFFEVAERGCTGPGDQRGRFSDGAFCR